MQAEAAPAHNSITLVLGGARSGKSSYAQSLASRAGRVLFLATAVPGDREMREKIERHRQDRLLDGLERWTVVEEPLHLSEVLRTQAAGYDLILIDCVTLHALGLLELASEELMLHLQNFYAALQSTSCSVVLVSNEVGSGVVPEFASGRQYRDLLGQINQRLAALATEVVFMVAGLPLTLKPGRA